MNSTIALPEAMCTTYRVTSPPLNCYTLSHSSSSNSSSPLLARGDGERNCGSILFNPEKGALVRSQQFVKMDKLLFLLVFSPFLLSLSRNEVLAVEGGGDKTLQELHKKLVENVSPKKCSELQLNRHVRSYSSGIQTNTRLLQEYVVLIWNSLSDMLTSCLVVRMNLDTFDLPGQSRGLPRPTQLPDRGLAGNRRAVDGHVRGRSGLHGGLEDTQVIWEGISRRKKMRS